MVFSAAKNAVDKYNDVMSTMMELGASEAFSRDDIMQKALATNKLSESMYKYMLDLGVTSIAEMTFSQKLKLTTIALKEQAAAFLASPLGKVAIIGAAIFAAVKIIDYFTSAEERAAEELANLESEFEELQNKINNASNEFRSLKSSADTVIPRFAELAKGVDALGNNVSLTDEEYSEFLSLNNQIADMFPELNMGMDSNGNAMLSLSYAADTLADSLWDVVEAQRAAANETIAATMPDVISNIDDTVDKYRDKIADLSDAQKEYFDFYSDFLNRSLKTNIGRYSTLESGNAAAEEFIAIAKELGINGAVYVDDQHGTNNGYVFTVEWDYTPLDHQLLLADIESNLQIATEKYNKLINDYYAKIEAKWSQLNPVVNSWLQTDFMFQDLDGTMQEIAMTMVSGLDFSSLGLKTQQDVQDYVQKNIIEPLFLATPEVKSAFENITDWKQMLQDGKISFEQFSDYVNNAFAGLFKTMDIDSIELFKMLFIGAFNQIGIAGSDFDTVLTNLIAEWGKAPSTVSEVSGSLNVFASVSERLSTSKENIDSIAEAMSKLSDGSLEVWDVIELIEKFPTLAEYVDLTADNFGDLETGLRALARSELENFIDEMEKFKETNDLTEEQEKHIDALCDSLSNLTTDSIQNLSGEFGVLAEQINAATAAQTELEKKLAEDDYDAGYEGRVEAYSGFQEVLDAGEYGSKAYAAYKEYFGLLEKSPEQISAWMDANKQYFTEGTDGVVAFMDTVESLSGDGGPLDGIASFDSETGAFWYDINQVSAFAETLDWSEEMLQDFIYKYRMYCKEWESRSPADAMQELTNAGLITQIGNLGDFSPTFASLKELQEYTGLGEQGVYNLIDSINELRAQEGLPNISLISRDITEVTTDMVARWQNAGATAEEIVAFIMDLAEQGVDIEPNLSFVLDDGTLVDIDTLLAEAGFEDTETVHVEIDMTVNDENVVAVVEATVGEVKEILGDNWEILLSADTEDSEKRIEAVQKLLEELPASTDVLLNDGTGLVRSSLSNVLDLLDDIDANKTKTITIRYQTIGLPMFAKGTKRATEGSALLGDEYSPTGSPKPELVVSDGRAYLAGQNGPEVGYLHDGDIVYTADETKRILRGNVLHKSIQAHAGGTPVDWSGLSSGLYNSSNTSNGSSSGNSSSGSDDESWFERQYKDHNHWLEMDKESVSDYLDWLDKAYKKAYDEGIIDIDDYYNYEEEVLQKTQDLFKDYLNDIDHEMSMLEAGVGNSNEIINLALQAIQRIEKELAAARAAGLDENGDYIQYLEQQWLNYSQTVTDLREDAETSAKNSVDDLVEYRIKMLKQDKDLKDMTPGEVYAVTASGRTENYFVLKDYMDITLGHDFDFENVESKVLAQDVWLDGNTAIDTDVTLFGENDRSFTLAIDYQFTDTTSNNTLVSCYEEDGQEGFRLRYNSYPNIQWGDVSQSVGSGKLRDMIVLRHRKGDSKLYIYASNSTSSSTNFDMAITRVELNRSRSATSNAVLTLGAVRFIADGGHDDYGKGYLHWCKVWYEDLGDTNARQLAAWCHEPLRMEYFGSGRYRLSGGTSKKTNASFICNHLLADRAMQMNTSNTNVGGWDECRMRTFLNSRIKVALPTVWQSMLKQTKINASAGNKLTEIVISDDYVFLPSTTEMNNNSSEPYTSEGAYISWYTSDIRRLKFKGITIPDDASYYTNASGSEPSSDQSNSVKSGDVWKIGGNSDGYIYVTQDYLDKHGITPGYTASIGGGWIKARFWWLRSPYVGGTTGFWYVHYYGDMTSASASYSYGVCPCFNI